MFTSKDVSESANCSVDAQHSLPGQPNQQNHKNSELIELLLNFSVDGYQWLAPIKGRSKVVIFLWACGHFFSSFYIVFTLANAWIAYFSFPWVTIVASKLYPIGAVPFPAVAICSNNRLSRYQSMLSIDERYGNLTTFGEYGSLEDIRNLGRLIDNDIPISSKFNYIQNNKNIEDEEMLQHVERRMQVLAPHCSDLMLKCVWRGIERSCVDPSMFKERLTQHGHCCTFNFVSSDSLDSTSENDSEYSDDIGADMGLILLLNGTSGDYFYQLRNFVGFIVQIFNPKEYPDLHSGTVVESIVELGYETLIRIDPITHEADHNMITHSKEVRGCLFPEELKDKFGGHYSRTECLISCRITSIIALCRCNMFQQRDRKILSPIEQDRRRNIPQCTLEDLPCLNRYRDKWSKITPGDIKYQSYDANDEQEDGLICPECLPICNDNVYRVNAQRLPMVATNKSGGWLLSNTDDVTDISLVRIFFGKKDTVLITISESLAAHQKFSNIGSIAGVVSGFSILSLVEIIYILGRLIYMRIRALRTSLKQKFPKKIESFNLLP